MELIVGGRRSGKTTKLVERVMQDPRDASIIVATESMKSLLFKQHPELTRAGVHIFSAANIGQARGQRVWIEDLEFMLGMNIDGGTMTVDTLTVAIRNQFLGEDL